MSKTLERTNRAILAVARDAYGNGISGNTERSLRYLQALVNLAELQQKLIESKNDVRAEQAFDAANRAIITSQDAGEWPAFDGSKVTESIEAWAKKGLTPSVLPKPTGAVAEKLRAAMDASKTSAEVRLEGDEVQQYLRELAAKPY